MSKPIYGDSTKGGAEISPDALKLIDYIGQTSFIANQISSNSFSKSQGLQSLATLRFDFTAYKGYPYVQLTRSTVQAERKKDADGKYSLSARSQRE